MLTFSKFRVTQNLPIFQNFEKYNLMKFKILEDVDVSTVEHPYFEKRINECGTVVDNVWDWIMTVFGHDNQGSNFRCNVVQYEGLDNPVYEVVYTEKLHNRDIVISSTCLGIKTALDKAVDAAYGYKPVLSKAEGGEKDDAARVAFLFELYQQLTAPLVEAEQIKKN